MALTQIPIELSSTPGIVDNSNATALTIDSSGNLLVGTTDTVIYDNSAGSSADNGLVYDASASRLDVTRYTTNASSAVALLNKTGSDGAILELRKDGTTVGAIGTEGGAADFTIKSDRTYLDLFTNGNTAGLTYRDDATARQFRPWGSKDALIDLGGSGQRFKNLYVSGGVFIGGTSSASYLDDYEEGTWTPTISSGTASFGFATYVKVGRLVHLTGRMQTISDTTSSTAVSIGGLPFTAASVQIATGSSFSGYTTKAGYYGSAVTYITASSSVLNFYWNGDSANYAILTHADFSSGASIYFSISYYANA